MAGYSGTPLAKKLGIKADNEVLLINAPVGFLDLLMPLPKNVQFVEQLSEATDLIHGFFTERSELAKMIDKCRKEMKPTASFWVSWPKKSAKKPTDITEDVVREVALPTGLVDIKVCAVDVTWSALKLVIRKELR